MSPLYLHLKRLDVLEETQQNHLSDVQSSVSRVLTAGVHRFNFAHCLPTSLPSSFESHVDHSRRRATASHHHHHQQQRKDELRIKVHLTRMWANAQRDGRPAQYRWRPLFNAAVWLTPATRVPCSNASKTRKLLKFAGVPQTRQQISAVSRPKFTML